MHIVHPPASLRSNNIVSTLGFHCFLFNKFAFGCFWYLLTFCFFAFCSVKKFDPITWCSAWQPDNADLGEKNASHLLRAVDRAASDHLVRHARAPEAGDAWLEVIRIIAENLRKEYRRHTTSKKLQKRLHCQVVNVFGMNSSDTM